MTQALDVIRLTDGIDALLNVKGTTPVPTPVLRRFDDIQFRDVDWLWKGWLAGGKLAIHGGHPGDGKSTLSLAIAARLSAGLVLPDGALPKPTSILILPSEDGAGDTILPRLAEHGADLRRCFVLDEIAEPTENDPFRTRPVSLTRDLAIIESVIIANAIGLLILDPITTFMPNADRNAEGDVRDALHPLLKVLDRTGCACLGIMHVGKPNGSSRRPLQQLLGSTAFGAIARLVWMVAPEPGASSGPSLSSDNDPAPPRMIFGVTKSNLWVKPAPLAWSRALDQPIEWHGKATVGIDEAMSIVHGADHGTDSNAIRFLREELKGGSVASVTLFKRAKTIGISESQLRTAGKHLDVKTYKETGTSVGSWYWRLPSRQRSEERMYEQIPQAEDLHQSGEKKDKSTDASGRVVNRAPVTSAAGPLLEDAETVNQPALVQSHDHRPALFCVDCDHPLPTNHRYRCGDCITAAHRGLVETPNDDRLIACPSADCNKGTYETHHPEGHGCTPLVGHRSRPDNIPVGPSTRTGYGE